MNNPSTHTALSAIRHADMSTAELLAVIAGIEAQCDALRALSIEQSVLLGELSKGLFYSDPLFGQIVGVGAKLDALSAPAVEE